MIEITKETLRFSFPKVHRKAVLNIELVRTLRIPDDDTEYSLPPGLGRFPIRHVDDFADKVPELWLDHGGVMFPMYQSEAMWLNFSSQHIDDCDTEYPFAIKIAAGKVNAVTGDAWNAGLTKEPQDYLVAPEQPWLDGYAIEKGVVRQFVAMPLAAGYTAEEQLTGKAEHGGLQIVVHPMKREVFDRRFPKRIERIEERVSCCEMGQMDLSMTFGGLDMGLAPGGRMKQEIYDDPFDFDDWSREDSSRCFVHIANSMVWSSITGKNPPTPPPTAKVYSLAGLPWFDYYSDSPALEGSKKLAELKSVAKLGDEKGEVPLPENEPVTVDNVIILRKGLNKNQVREGSF